jgi:hypothetical protein
MATRLQTRKTLGQAAARQKMQELYGSTPLPRNELMVNFPLYTRSSALAKQMYIYELYQHILPLPGVIFEFGVWWGANLAMFTNFRAILEPYNYARRVVGFDTFEGYSKPTPEDGTDDLVCEGNYSVPADYLTHLQGVLDCHEEENVMPHLKKYDLIKGDAGETVPRYMREHPETIIALAYFDMQLYKPTLDCLKAIRPRLTKGSVIAMDELNCPEFPGETQAFDEVFKICNVRLKRSTFLPDRTIFIVE